MSHLVLLTPTTTSLPRLLAITPDMALKTFGVPPNNWSWSEEQGYDLSRGQDRCNTRIISTQKGEIRIDPARSALVVIDNQNYFLHPAFRKHPTGLVAMQQLIKNGIPTSRAAGVKVIWLNWGLTDEEITNMPPCHAASFGGVPTTKHGEGGGFGAELGLIDGRDAGRRVVRGSWNAELYGDLQPLYEEGEKLGTDVWIHKNRPSGIWGEGGALETYLRGNKIETLFFAGVNSDQCVWGTLIDAHNKGFDVIYVKDLCATGMPEARRESTEYNADVVGFITTSAEYAKGLQG
ncbi:hypothetical protein P7C70_g5224, partial [Phenoliferia sp. Uapishka_3]